MTEKEAIEILSHMATISDLIEGEENAEKRAEAVSMAMVALMAPKKMEGWLARDWIGGNLVFFKEKPTTKRAGMWEDTEGNTGGVLTRYGHDDFDIEWESEPIHVELSIMSI